ncbi:AIG1 domain-containing protein [Ceratobasidium sp. AG-Ba]|nr:AIG1 domain-containing protein [Ceratobasidium sp. AG-Ba]
MVATSRTTTPLVDSSDNVVDEGLVKSITSDMESVSIDRRNPLPNKEHLHDTILAETNKQIFTILLIGETGCGKTAFMSLLSNLLHGRGPLELKDYHDESKESGRSKIHSQTTRATLYSIAASDGRTFQILDTPGLADTRGIRQDKAHKDEINAAIKEFIPSIDAVIIMANGTSQRLNIVTDYALNAICSMFPRSITHNIGFIFTHCDGTSLNFEPESLQPELRESPLWAIQNPLSIHRNLQKAAAYNRYSQNPLEKLHNCYDETVLVLNDWLKWLDGLELRTTLEIDRLYQISTSIEAGIDSALATITTLAEQRDQYKKIRLSLNDAKKAEHALNEMKRRESTPVWIRQNTELPNTLCIAPNCRSNCHAPCNMQMTEDYTSLGRWCAVFKNYRPLPVWDGASAICKVCLHPSRDHRHYRQIHAKQMPYSDPEKKTELENASAEAGVLENARAVTKRRLLEIQEEIDSAQDSVRTLIEDFNELSLSRSFAGHIRSAIQMLKLRREDLRAKANTDLELELIEESIAQFEQQLALLATEESKWSRAKALFQTVRDYVPDDILSSRPPNDQSSVQVEQLLFTR